MSTNARLFDVEWLEAANNQGYGPLPIPTRRDQQISVVIRQWALLDAAERRGSSCSIKEDHRATLLAYSERMASQAVREKSRELILLGLLALGLDGWRTDWRENALLLCLHFNAAEKIRVAPDVVFGDAAKLLPSNVGTSLMGFIKRAPEDQNLEAMGYKESVDGDGFRYERSW